MSTDGQKPADAPVAADQALVIPDPSTPALTDGEKRSDGLLEQILKSIRLQEASQAERLSFEVSPNQQRNQYGTLFLLKENLTPDFVIKKIIGPSGDELVCQILQARSNHASSFFRPRKSRFDVGMEFEPISEDILPNDPEAISKINQRITEVKKLLWNCGYEDIDDTYQKPNLSDFGKMITRDGIAYGRCAFEFIMDRTAEGNARYRGFRPVDAGTIYRFQPKKEQDQAARQEAIKLIADLKGIDLDAKMFEEERYKYVQYIDGQPVASFTDEEMVMHNFYPVTNVEYNGYPLTPIDQALNAITTHINITQHNKLFFQNGRAAHGFLTFESESTPEESNIQRIRSTFYQAVNSVNNAHRLPVFGISQGEKLSFQSIDSTGRDAEFQYLSDNNCRVILSAFQMSPDELPGYSHLSRGTNTQALSESNNEYKLTAQRDVGLRPLIYTLQDIMNTHILPKFAPDLAKTHQIVLAGLDKEDPEKESTRLAQDMNLHLTYDDILEKVEKKPLGRSFGGQMPLNQTFVGQVISPYFTVGEILENFFGLKDASKDPRYAYVRDQFWMQQQQMLMQKMQMQMQAQMMQQQAMMAQQQPPQDPNDPNGGGQPPQGGGQPEQLQQSEVHATYNYAALEKSISADSNTLSKMILDRHTKTVNSLMDRAKADAEKAKKEIVKQAKSKKRD